MEQTQKRDVGGHKIFFSREIVISVSFLCLGITNKDTCDRSRRHFV